ncbi:MAG TPA: efflux transporter outer membrane subunit [Steroidobacteraceae bacterium]|nr:efflux transporter outer membrane subunit [Steroidobacteraceae bacterium]
MSGPRLIAWGVALGACLLGAACKTVGPDYRGPPPAAVVNSPAANRAFLGASDAAFSQELPPDAWWRLYDSVALDGMVQEALKTNTDLREASANLERSAALLREVRAQRQPSVEVNFDPSLQQLSPESYLHAGAVSPMGLYDTGISVSYEVDLFGRLRRAVEAASADDEAVKAAYDLAQVNVAAEVARAYADVCGAGEQLAVARHSLQLQLESTGVTQRLVDAGRMSMLDFTRSAGLAAQIKANIPKFEARRTNALYRLAALMGRPPSEYPRAIESCAESPRLSRPIPVGDGAALLRRRPDVREGERLLAAATARIGVATADLYPRVTLGVSAGSTGALADFLTTPTNRYGLGVGIHWQANQSLARARIDSATAATRFALAQFDGAVLGALRETESALTIYAHDLKSDEDLAAAEARASEAEHEADQLYRGGKIDFLSLLDAQRTLDSADDQLAASHVQLATDQIELFLALGGGWL